MSEEARVPGEELNLDKIIFSMDPQTAVWKLIRILVSDLTTLAALQRSADTARRYGDLTASATQRALERYELYRSNWYTDTLPRIVAGFKVLKDFRDSSALGNSRISDSIDAASWKRKYQGWLVEFVFTAAGDRT